MKGAAILLCAMIAGPTIAQAQTMPSGFDLGAWDYMTRDQKFHVQVVIEDDPRPITVDSQTAVENMVRGRLKDPDSAKFRDIRRRGPFDYCGWVNAKNSLGGFVGYSVFFASNKWTVILPPAASEPRFCK